MINKQIHEYFAKMAFIQERLLEYLNADTNRDDDFNYFLRHISDIRYIFQNFKQSSPKSIFYC